jgi:hypothetical protein
MERKLTAILKCGCRRLQSSDGRGRVEGVRAWLVTLQHLSVSTKPFHPDPRLDETTILRIGFA